MGGWVDDGMNVCIRVPALTLKDASAFFVLYFFQEDVGSPATQAAEARGCWGSPWGSNSPGCLGPAVGIGIRALPRAVPGSAGLGSMALLAGR